MAMPERLSRTPDIPDFDTYPGESPERTLPARTTNTSAQPRLQDTAESIGEAVGSAVQKIRELPNQLQSLKGRFTVITGRGRAQAGQKTEELKDAAADQVRRARTRAEYLVREYPLRVILGAAGAAFVLGFALRIWRSKRG